MNKIKIQKNTVQETLIIPLYTRKLCTEMYPSIYQDYKAEVLLNKLDYDFSVMNHKLNTTMGKFGVLETAMRQYDLSYEIKTYLKNHPYASIINLGCGLDQTAENCDNGTCQIYNIDFPEVIEIRNQLLPEKDRIKNIGCNLNDQKWFKKVKTTHGAIFIAAGVFYYFRKDEIKELFTSMSKEFQHCVLVFDTAGKKAVKMMIKNWVKGLEINDVNAYFYVGDIEEDLSPWLKDSSITYRGYMLGYHSLKDPTISHLFRLLSKIGDTIMKMKIIKIIF